MEIPIPKVRRISSGWAATLSLTADAFAVCSLHTFQTQASSGESAVTPKAAPRMHVELRPDMSLRFPSKSELNPINRYVKTYESDPILWKWIDYFEPYHMAFHAFRYRALSRVYRG